MGLKEQIKAIGEELKRTPYNKATQHHIGRFKAKLATLKLQLEKEEFKAKRARAKAGIRKSGNATIGLIGFPNVGKSTLLNELTSARSTISDCQLLHPDGWSLARESHRKS